MKAKAKRTAPCEGKMFPPPSWKQIFLWMCHARFERKHFLPEPNDFSFFQRATDGERQYFYDNFLSEARQPAPVLISLFRHFESERRRAVGDGINGRILIFTKNAENYGFDDSFWIETTNLWSATFTSSAHMCMLGDGLLYKHSAGSVWQSRIFV